jgi:ATP-dependent DNA ligase
MNEFSKLYMMDAKGYIREWRISRDENDIIIEHGVKGGAMTRQIETVESGKAGRTLDEQILSRIASRIHKQRDKGYSPDINDANRRPVNSLGLIKPMLAQKDVQKIDYSNAFIQRKYDGNRLLVTNLNGQNIAYSRNGKLVESINHILDEIEIPEGYTLDGEIYCHGYPLQTIVSWVKRKQENSLKLKYHVYDIVSGLKYSDRMKFLQDVDYGSNAEFVETRPVNCHEEAMENFREFREDGYEGAIVRWGDFGYEDGKRSKSLVKIKEWFDNEYLVIDITPSADGWAVLTCMINDGNEFKVSAPGDISEKTFVYEHKEAFIGKLITVEYSHITNAGRPFHPVAIRWRDNDV